jgi:lipopolysaccharide export system protein LptC
MIKNFKDTVILSLTSGILILLGVIIIGDYWIAVKENRPVDTEVITSNENVDYGFNRYNRRLYWW